MVKLNCMSEINKLERLLERELSQHEKELFEYAYNKGEISNGERSEKPSQRNPYVIEFNSDGTRIDR